MPRNVAANPGWHWIPAFRKMTLRSLKVRALASHLGKPLKDLHGGESGKSLSQRKQSCRDRRTLHPSSKRIQMKDASDVHAQSRIDQRRRNRPDAGNTRFRRR
jgi:hypothetical protein